jgi:chitodextrinase
LRKRVTIRTSGDASLWISTKPGESGSTTVSSTNWASGVINGVAIVVHGRGADAQAPTAPENLTATAVSSSQINLSWSASTDNVGVTGYLVERQGPGSTGFAQVGTTAGTTYNDTGLVAGTNYSYRVRATDATGNLSAYSAVASATTLALPPSLVAAYSFNEGTGTSVTDVSGSGNNGTIANATWTTAGKYGNALVFNGTTALVTINDSASLDLTKRDDTGGVGQSVGGQQCLAGCGL